jgi:hypothetical protein
VSQAGAWSGTPRTGARSAIFRDPIGPLVKEAIGKGVGLFLVNFAIDRAWARPIRRLWAHTCNFDHPAALAFYYRSGFRPYAFMADVADDPRLTGHMPRTAAPHVPLLDMPGAHPPIQVRPH